MKTVTNRRVGAAIALLGAIVAAAGAVDGLPIPIVVGIAVVCILIGTGVAKGKFSHASAGVTKKWM